MKWEAAVKEPLRPTFLSWAINIIHKKSTLPLSPEQVPTFDIRQPSGDASAYYDICVFIKP